MQAKLGIENYPARKTSPRTAVEFEVKPAIQSITKRVGDHRPTSRYLLPLRSTSSGFQSQNHRFLLAAEEDFSWPWLLVLAGQCLEWEKERLRHRDAMASGSRRWEEAKGHLKGESDDLARQRAQEELRELDSVQGWLLAVLQVPVEGELLGGRQEQVQESAQA